MTDELTPEEREALESLPRERMPSAALEERVVGAMRARGFVAARPSRVVRITNSRVAGLMAACIVLIVGAYAIGLHRGGDNPVLRSVALPQRDAGSMKESNELSTPAQKKETVRESARAKQLSTPPAPSTDAHAARGAVSEFKEDVQERKAEPDVGRADEPATDKLAKDVSRENEVTAPSQKHQKAAAPPALRPSTMAFSNSLQAQRAEESAAPAGPREQSFTLGGSKLVIEAPDSVRVVRDDRGRWLLIYTSDGLIRIRLAD